MSRIPGHKIAQQLYRRLPLGRPVFPLLRPFLGPGKLLSIPFGGGELLLPTEWADINIVHGLVGGQPFLNPELTPMLEAERLLEGRRGAVVDVGAAIGTYVLWLRRRFANPIVAFEPSPVAAAVLGEMIRMNGLQDVDVRQVALGARAGGFFALRIGANSHVDARASVSTNDSDAEPRDWLSSDVFKAIKEHALVKQVPISTLDEQLRSHDSVAFIKIDVEGLEFQVLQGARETIERHRPVIWMEGHPRFIGGFGDRLDEVFDLLRSNEYRLRIWEERLNGHDSKLGRMLGRMGGPAYRETTWESIASEAGAGGLPMQIFVLAEPSRLPH